MTDSLTVFGTDFTGVTGIKAKGTGNGTLTYIRPQGTKSISANGTGIDVTEYASVDVSVSSGIDMPVFTLTFDANWDIDSLTCNKTFAECVSYITDDNKGGAYIYSVLDDPQNPWSEEVILTSVSFSESRIIYTGFYGATPGFDVIYNSDGTIDYTPNSAFNLELEATSNGTYQPVAYTNIPGVYSYVTVNVPSSGTYQAKTNISPTTSSQTITPDNGYDALSSVQINAMPSGTAGTPTAAKGSVSNHSVGVTPSVTNTTGYITGSTKTGTAVTVSASELVSGTYTVSASGSHDVTNYASASVAAGSATASATKGTVSNHQVTVTPSVTRTAGYVTAGSANGTAVTVSASELVSGSETKTANGTYDVTNLASLVVSIPFITYYTGTSNPSSSQGSNGDIYLKTVS